MGHGPCYPAPDRSADAKPSISGKPVTEKDSGHGVAAQQRLAWGFSSMQGWRDEMEDAHVAVPCLGAWVGRRARARGWGATAVFGVMDGHGGAHVARFCEEHLLEKIAEAPSEDMTHALVAAFHQIDEMLVDPEHQEELCEFAQARATVAHNVCGSIEHTICGPYGRSMASQTGCTAIVCCIREDKIVVASAGDSRAVLCRGGVAIQLSYDHKPTLPTEYERIINAGGWLDEEQRVKGDLNLSRAIGDLEYKQREDLLPGDQMISATPDVHYVQHRSDDEFIVIACDGVWDVMANQEVVDFVRGRLDHAVVDLAQPSSDPGLRLSAIVEELLDSCIGSGDNLTAILVRFQPCGPSLPSQR